MRNDVTTPTDQDIADVGNLVNGYINTQLLYISKKLRLIELLADGSKSLDELTELTQCPKTTLVRFLRGMCALRLLSEADGQYNQGPLLNMASACLAPGFDHTSYQSWDKVMHTVQTGEPAWDQVFGQSFYDYLDDNPEQSAAYDQWNDSSALWLDPLISQYDFTQFNRLVDLGGGKGRFISKVLNANPALQGGVLDRPEVIENTKVALKDSPLQSRITTYPGSFFDSVPNDADGYSLCRVLLNWSDEHTINILKTCAKSMDASSKLLIFDFFIPQPDEPGYKNIVINDLIMLVNYGGRARTLAQWQQVIEAAGLKQQQFLTAPGSALFLMEIGI
ncbi:MAG: hypothetical protein MJK04_12935 [Psychrosphaera sp.]|nr:hypothetical protein [Psychrosphaera sp.]